MILTADEVLAGGTAYAPGWLQVDGPRIRAVGGGPLPTGSDGSRYDLGAVRVVPGLVDLHCHGGGGADLGGTAEEIERAAAFHLAHGTTTMLAGLVSAAPEVLLRQVRTLADAVEAGIVAGIHLEGPWLSPRRRGAHAVEALRLPDRAELRSLVTAGRGAVAMITIAPELPGSMDLIRAAVDLGVVVAVGHTDADHATTVAAVDAGARVATHLFNAMRPIHHREPGPIVAALEDERVHVEVILDGVHLHRSVYRHVASVAGPGRALLVTDATAAAGMPDGRYRLGGLAVLVRGGRATIDHGEDDRAGAEVIAGSTATADAVFARAVQWSLGLAAGGLEGAVAMSSAGPAAVLGRTGHDLAPGARADLVVLGEDLQLRAVMRAGRWVPTAAGDRPR